MMLSLRANATTRVTLALRAKHNMTAASVLFTRGNKFASIVVKEHKNTHVIRIPN